MGWESIVLSHACMILKGIREEYGAGGVQYTSVHSALRNILLNFLQKAKMSKSYTGAPLVRERERRAGERRQDSPRTSAPVLTAWQNPSPRWMHLIVHLPLHLCRWTELEKNVQPSKTGSLNTGSRTSRGLSWVHPRTTYPECSHQNRFPARTIRVVSKNADVWISSPNILMELALCVAWTCRL